jgi:hypothetical protein
LAQLKVLINLLNRERQRETKRQRDRETERQRDNERQWETMRDNERHWETKRQEKRQRAENINPGLHRVVQLVINMINS